MYTDIEKEVLYFKAKTLQNFFSGEQKLSHKARKGREKEERQKD